MEISIPRKALDDLHFKEIMDASKLFGINPKWAIARRLDYVFNLLSGTFFTTNDINAIAENHGVNPTWLKASKIAKTQKELEDFNDKISSLAESDDPFILNIFLPENTKRRDTLYRQLKALLVTPEEGEIIKVLNSIAGKHGYTEERLLNLEKTSNLPSGVLKKLKLKELNTQIQFQELRIDLMENGEYEEGLKEYFLLSAREELKKLKSDLAILSPVQRTNSKLVSQADIQHALNYPIERFFPGWNGRSRVRCPFHNDKNPDMRIRTEDNKVRCFVCNRTWDSVAFIQELEGLEFIPAVRRLMNW